MKYVDGDEKVINCRKTSIQGVENYFTDSLLYLDSLETYENP